MACLTNLNQICVNHIDKSCINFAICSNMEIIAACGLYCNNRSNLKNQHLFSCIKSNTLNFLLQVAETQRYANMAAKQVIVEYSTEDLESPILTVEDAVEKSSYFDVASGYEPKEVGDFSKGMEEADLKILSAEVLFFVLLSYYFDFHFRGIY